MTAFSVQLILLVVGLCLVYLGWRIRQTYLYIRETIKALDKLPQLPWKGWLGHIPDIAKFGWSGFNEKCLKEFMKNGEKAYVAWLTIFFPIVTVSHPDTAKIVMKSAESKGYHSMSGYTYLREWLGNSILVETGERWMRNRRLLTPAFHFGILENYIKIQNEVADDLLTKLSDSINKSVDIVKPMKLAALDVLLQSVFSCTEHVLDSGSDHPYNAAVERLETLIVTRAFKIYQIPAATYWLTSEGREFYRLTKYVQGFSSQIIKKRKQEMTENPEGLQKRYPDFLDILLKATDEDGQGLSDEEIRWETDTFMFAGHETTGTVLIYFIYALGQYQQHQEEIYKELMEVLGERNTVKSQDFMKLKKLTSFLKEVMRLYTPVPTGARELTKPLEILPGVIIPEGITISMSIRNIHHNPAVWENPDKFCPGRFETEGLNDRDPYSFVPFSAGARNCIGQHFALNELKVMLSKIIKRYQISSDPEHEVNLEPYNATLTSKTGVKVIFSER